MNKVKLTIATTDYDHFRDFRTGAVEAQGIEHTWLTLGHHEIFSRFTFNREWDVTELSFAKFTAQVTRDNPDIIGLPVFASRLFRFGSFYVNRKSGIKTAADLKGKTIGSPEWAHTAAVYMRGWLHNEAGVQLTDVHWYQAGANEAGRIEKVELDLPAGLKLTRVADKSLSDMLAAGEIDCALIARPPTCFLRGHPDIVRLFPDFLEREEEHFAKIQGVSDHARDRGEAQHPRRQSLDRAQPLQRLRGVQAPQPGAPARPRGVALSAAVAADLCAPDARPVRRRSLPVRDRGEPADARNLPRLLPPAGHRPPPRQAGGDLPAGIMAPVKV